MRSKHCCWFVVGMIIWLLFGFAVCFSVVLCLFVFVVVAAVAAAAAKGASGGFVDNTPSIRCLSFNAII